MLFSRVCLLVVVTPSRRDLLQAVAVGGTTGIAACLGGPAEDPIVARPNGSLPAGQHEWQSGLATDADGNDVLPVHHVYLFCRLTADPTDTDRDRLERALSSLERAAAWRSTGLFCTVGYSAQYFDRFDVPLRDVELPTPAELSEEIDKFPGGQPPDLDDADLFVHLASDEAAGVLAAEAALRGDRTTFNGTTMDGSLPDRVAIVDRRSGFVAPGLPAAKQAERAVEPLPDEPIDDQAPLWMGFRAGYRASQASETEVTIDTGPFAGGTVATLETFEVAVDLWYRDHDHAGRIELMFSPGHDPATVGSVGERLGSDPDNAAAADAIHDDLERAGKVGHAQKAARARVDGRPRLLRRDVNTVDFDVPGIHFLALSQSAADYVTVRNALAADDLPLPVGAPSVNGITQYLHATHRGVYLTPPRTDRSFPRPAGIRP